MSSASRVIAVIPAFNEARTIAAVVAGVRARVADVIVVDDHSMDATGEEAKRAGAIVLRNAANLGYDGSLNAGFAEAARRGAGIILTFDADGEHDPADAPPRPGYGTGMLLHRDVQTGHAQRYRQDSGQQQGLKHC